MIQPLGNRVVLLPEETDDTVTKSGIILAKQEKSLPPERGSIVAVGPEVKDLAEGNYVLFSRYAPDEVKIEDVTYLILKADAVLARLS